MDFHALHLPKPVLDGIDSVGFTTCTAIQEKTLPLSLAGKDVAGQAQTGTGKTAAFLITTFTRLLKRRHPRYADEAAHPAHPAHPAKDTHDGGPGDQHSPRALIIAPTRELAVQIYEDALGLGEFTGLTMCAVYGGVDYGKQRDALRDGCDILIGTPGRLIDYLKQRVYSLRHIEVLVIDEADRMFDMGFIADLRFMLRRLPSYDKRQSMLFSATLSWEVMELAYEHMNDPVKVSVTPEQLTAINVEHVLYHVGKYEKLPMLLGILKHEQPTRTMVFVNTKRQGEWLASRLVDNGHRAAAITGDINQRVRLRLLNEFKSGELPILVATDVASRGLHIEAVSHVVNYDLPQDPEDYVHRVGRTARAGASGRALSLACEEYVMGLEPIETLTGFKIPHVAVEDDMLVAPVPPPHSHRQRRGPTGPGDRGGASHGTHGQPGRPRKPGQPGAGARAR